MKSNKNKHLTIIGKRWFQKSFGNTYHSTRVLIDGIEVYHCPFNYGYDDSFIQTAIKGMQEAGILAKDKDYWTQHLRDEFKSFNTIRTDVTRKRDL